MKTYFFDVTDIVLYIKKETSVSGIQRVSLEVIRQMIARHGQAAVRLGYWDQGRRVYRTVACDFLAEMDSFDTDILGAVFFGRGARPLSDTRPTLKRYRNQPLKYAFHRVMRGYHAVRGNEAYFAKHGSSLAAWRAFRRPPRAMRAAGYRKPRHLPITQLARPGDQLVVMGATWDIEGIGRCFQHLADQHGLKIRLLVHDLIPMITPEHVAAKAAARFAPWLRASTGYCAGYLANSQNTARDLRRFMAGIGARVPVTVVPLAQAFTPPTVAHSVRQEITELAEGAFVLVVGTMEQRKNILKLAQAWQRLLAEPGLAVPRLVFAGKRGWDNGAFEQFMAETNHLDGHVQIVDRPNDSELAVLYEACLFTAMISFYEGWGLPIGESLSHGKTAVVAENSSMPEVGGDMVAYCDAQSLDSIHAACLKLIAEPAYRETLEARIAQTKLRSWEDVAADFVKALEG